jgi:phosphocarrier protein HPr
MITKSFVVQNSVGLQARPATLFVRKAVAFSCEVNIIKGNIKIDAKSIMAVMSMGITKGAEITLEVNGEQETRVFEELKEILVSTHD